MANIIYEKKLVPNRILFTKDGSRIGNSVITEIRQQNAWAPKQFFGISDYGNKWGPLNTLEVSLQFNLGPLADRTHKHYSKPVPKPLNWVDIKAMVEILTNREGLSDDQVYTLIAQAKPVAREDLQASRPPTARKPIWRQGEEVTSHRLQPEAPAPAKVVGDPQDYFL